MKRLTLTPIAIALLLTGCNSSDSDNNLQQPQVHSRVHDVLNVDSYQFREAMEHWNPLKTGDYLLKSEQQTWLAE